MVDAQAEAERLCVTLAVNEAEDEALRLEEALKEAPELDVPETECDGERLGWAE